jgi:hypothetical protein
MLVLPGLFSLKTPVKSSGNSAATLANVSKR